MRQKMVWFLLGVLLGSLMLVYAGNPPNNLEEGCHSDTMPALLAKASSNYSIQGPFNWTPRPISKQLPVEVLNLAKSKYPPLRNANYVVTILNKDANYSIFQSGDKVIYLKWDFERNMEIGNIKFKLVINNTKVSSKEVGSALGYKFKVIKTIHINKWRATAPTTLNNLYIVTASATYTWYAKSPITGKESKWSETTAKGKFYVDYGNAIVGISDMSSEWHDTGVTVCSFDHESRGVGSVSGEVYADAKYLVPSIPLGIHLDAHARVYVDAWTNVDTDWWGNKGVGRPWCP